MLPWIQALNMTSVPSRNSLYLNFSVQKTVNISHLCRREFKELMLCEIKPAVCFCVWRNKQPDFSSASSEPVGGFLDRRL